jgi:hypothetical protein
MCPRRRAVHSDGLRARTPETRLLPQRCFPASLRLTFSPTRHRCRYDYEEMVNRMAANLPGRFPTRPYIFGRCCGLRRGQFNEDHKPGTAEQQPRKRKQFHHKGTKNTKLRSLEIAFSETFVAFVCFVVRKGFL